MVVASMRIMSAADTEVGKDITVTGEVKLNRKHLTEYCMYCVIVDGLSVHVLSTVYTSCIA